MYKSSLFLDKLYAGVLSTVAIGTFKKKNSNTIIL